jgi:hypothetical protein
MDPLSQDYLMSEEAAWGDLLSRVTMKLPVAPDEFDSKYPTKVIQLCVSAYASGFDGQGIVPSETLCMNGNMVLAAYNQKGYLSRESQLSSRPVLDLLHPQPDVTLSGPAETRLHYIESSLELHWRDQFMGGAKDIFVSVLAKNDEDMAKDPQTRYSRALILVQSSGMGKSRLLDEYSKICPVVNFILRPEGVTGYPPSDAEVMSFAIEVPDQSTMETLLKLCFFTNHSQPPLDSSKMIAQRGPKSTMYREISRKPENELLLSAWYHATAITLLHSTFDCRKCFLCLTLFASQEHKLNPLYSQFLGQGTRG